VQNAENHAMGGEQFQRSAGVHGGNIYEAIKRYGIASGKIIDFSSNVNPLGPSSSALSAAKRALSFIERYPDPVLADLRLEVARYYGIKQAHVVCASGSNALIHLIPRVFRPKKVLIPGPTYSEYAAAADAAGAEVAVLQLNERDGFRIDPLEMAFAFKGVDMAFLCNPNNPTGLLMSKAEMLEIAKYALNQGVRLVVDEAFMDFINSESVVKEAVQSSHIICLRTFSLFFGMPGLRIGYAISDETTASALRAFQEPWKISLPAEQAAIAALHDWRYARKTLLNMGKERERILSTVRLLPEVETFPCSANFVFIKVSLSKAPLLAEKLAHRGFLIRDCSSFPGLDNRFIRISVRTRSENKRMLRALKELLTCD
jgi:threonine-phosphate decarboxylase